MTEPSSRPDAPSPPWRRAALRLLRWRVWLTERGPLRGRDANFLWAALIGFAGALSSIAFRDALGWLQAHLYAGRHGSLEETAAALPAWERLLVPALGGLVAGALLLLGEKWQREGRSLDFMEAVVLGNGVIRVRGTVAKSLSSLVTISSGGSIGREGPMVQLAAMLGSLAGRAAGFPSARLRLFVACGAAAGIACAYNAPLAGAFFVAEIVLGSIAMESFLPLVVASVAATVTARQFLGAQPVYRMPDFGPVPNWQLLAHAGLGVAAGLAAPLFLGALRGGEELFRRTRLPVMARLGLGGLAVGLISLAEPAVWGNGYHAAESILNQPPPWTALAAILAMKVLATAATGGSGAVGGVFTPTLFCGAALGALYGELLRALFPHAPVTVSSFAVVGMGCFLAATTRAPIMAILIIFEMTLTYAAMMPLMLACGAAYYVARGLKAESVYSRRLLGHAPAEPPLFLLHVRDLMKPAPLAVRETADFGQVARALSSHTFKHLYVTDGEGRFLGAIALQDLKPFLHEDFSDVALALDLMHDDVPVLAGDDSLKESLEVFSRHDGERLPVINNRRDRRLIGALAKTDVLLALAHGAGGRDAGD